MEKSHVSERKFFTAGDGTRIAYRLDGPAELPVLILSNSIATTLNMWDDEIPALQRHFRVLRYDFRGHGGSSAPPGAYSVARLGRDVLELMDSLDLPRVHFLGLSLGGMVGQWLGIHAPDRLHRLILSNTSAYLGPPSQIDERIAATLNAPNLEATADTFLRNWLPPHLLQNEPVVKRFRNMVLATDPHGLAGCFAAVRDMDLRRTIALIPVPTLVIAGQYDTVTLASHGEAIAATIPGARLLTLPAVHLANIEYPREFLDAVLGFLQESRSSSDEPHRA
jgi:3-oxoadipate enol-lactonase